MEDGLESVKEKYGRLLRNLEQSIKKGDKKQINEDVSQTISEVLKLKRVLENKKYGI